jgi:hypothetical protein
MMASSLAARADLLTNNFWVNPFFEIGSNLDQTDGTVSNWNRGGGDPTICQVITNNSVSPTHSLALIDTNTTGAGYGEWYSDVPLSGNANPGDALDIQWYQMYNLSAPEMRLTVLFLDVSNNVLTATHFVTSGTSSPGWVSTIADSTFTKMNGSLSVPCGAVTMRCSLVSGGSASITGVMVIDDLSVAPAACSTAPPPTILPCNFFPNPTFECGANLDNPSNASPASWSRGGNDPSIDQVTTNNSVSPTHSLALVDNSFGYGEWYQFLPLCGIVAGDVLQVQFFRIYHIFDATGATNASMRLSLAFIDVNGFALTNTDFNAFGDSPGWTGSIATSPFERVTGTLVVPVGTVQLRANFASGGAGSVEGTIVIDDLSVAVLDTEAPQVACQPAPNPSGKKIPPSGKNGNVGNPDGYFQLLARDNCDPNPAIYVQDTGSAFRAGPFADGDIVKLVKNPGGPAFSSAGNPPIVAIIHLIGDGLVIAVDADGNETAAANGCLMQKTAE